ncbi:DUF5996 family protein [Longimicrobium sp.]|uniref:DUF5996 family protein n=1 Tax=Longimicrobium sp. TaxID=2029185 RepID=UPI002D12E86D|nr:DUF5996 family protein [Longimicrobium sp.]HSU16398.1 DUF5996 family protein [Longimicrobium sp.]
MTIAESRAAAAWPALELDAWEPTRDTLHLWTQVVGKVRMALSPWVNHWWHVPLYVSARGLTTSAIPYGAGAFQIDFDFIAPQLVISCSDGQSRTMRLEPMTVADFHAGVMARLRELGIGVRIWPVPVELPDPIPFPDDTVHAAYDPEYAHRFWRVLAQSTRVMTEFRGAFLGKCSPVHFFWGSFDLAVTRFSGRTAPPHPGAPNVADAVTREAYSHEVSSAGFWPGGGPMREAIFYAYAYPGPDGFAGYPVRPAAASWSPDFGEFILPYDAVRTAADPDATLHAFLESTYEAAAELAKWDRKALERG